MTAKWSGLAAIACAVMLLAPAVAAAQAPTPAAPVERSEILERLGVAALQLGDHEAAVRHFRAALAAGRDRAELRERLGFALAQLGRCPEAIDELEIAVRRGATARAQLYTARCHERLDRPGLAIHAFEQALARLAELSAAEQKSAYDALGYLYLAEGQTARAIDVLERSLALAHDPEMVVRLGRAYRLLGNLSHARRTLAGVTGADLSPAQNAARLDELAEIARAEGRLLDRLAALTEAVRIEPTALRHYTLGVVLRDLGRPGPALGHLEQAHALAPDDARHAAELGYAYKHAGRLREAARLFESVVARDPGQVKLYEELGYLYFALSDTQRAIASFRKAIDGSAPTDVRRLQAEIARLANRFDVAAYLTYRSSSAQPGAGPTGTPGGSLPSQSGVEVAYQPPVIGFRDERVFQVVARLLFNLEPGSPAIDDDSVQAGLGARYKPLKRTNLFLGVERLVAIGDRAADDWLLRTTYSWDHRPPSGSRSANYTTLYADAAYLVDATTWIVAGEARQGVVLNPTGRVVVTPHLVADGRYQENSRGATDAFVEGGAGVLFRHPFAYARFEGYRATAELAVQYKAGTFLERAGRQRDDAFHGAVLTWALRF